MVEVTSAVHLQRILLLWFLHPIIENPGCEIISTQMSGEFHDIAKKVQQTTHERVDQIMRNTFYRVLLQDHPKGTNVPVNLLNINLMNSTNVF